MGPCAGTIWVKKKCTHVHLCATCNLSLATSNGIGISESRDDSGHGSRVSVLAQSYDRVCLSVTAECFLCAQLAS